MPQYDDMPRPTLIGAGGTGELLAHRRTLAVMIRTVDDLRALGRNTQAEDLAAEAQALWEAEFAVWHPCLLCQVQYPVAFKVGGSDIPNSYVCGVCSARIDEHVEREGAKARARDEADQSEADHYRSSAEDVPGA